MKFFVRGLAAAALPAFPFTANAQITYPKTATVIVDTTGTEKGTSANPIYVSGGTGGGGGDSRAARALQTLAGATADGHIGPVTLAQLQQHVAKTSLSAVIVSYQAARQSYLESLNGFSHDGNGWTHRVNRIKAAALALVN